MVPAAPVAGAPPFRITVIDDPGWTEPLVLATTLPVSARALRVSARALRDPYLDRWPVEPLPLAAKQMLGAARAFVSAPETCQRLPELALLAGSILTAHLPKGYWGQRRRPPPTDDSSRTSDPPRPAADVA